MLKYIILIAIFDQQILMNRNF